MKILLVLLFAGLAYGTSHYALKRASEEVFESFIYGMTHAPPLHEVLGIQNTEELKRFERDLKDELAEYLRKAFDDALEKIEEAVKNGKEVHKEALQKLKELREKMNDLQINDDERGEEYIKYLKEKVKGDLKTILEKMGIIEKRSLHSQYRADESITDLLEDFNIRDFVIRLRDVILKKMDVEALKKSLAKFVGQGAQRLCEWLTNKGKDKVMGFIDRLLDKDEDKKKRSVSDFYEEVKEYFEDLDLDLKQKFFKFGEWVKGVLEKGLDKTKSKIEKVKIIAKQLLDKSKVISKEVAEQALDYLRDYREELGELYEKLHRKLVEKIRNSTD